MSTSACRTKSPRASRKFTSSCCTACATRSTSSCSEKRHEEGERRALRSVSEAPRFEAKIRAPQDLARWLTALPRPLVFTNGVFDILHRGHVTYLARARALGASLLVALNDDASVRRLGKGGERPINALEDRLAVIAALSMVDAVTWFEEDTPAQLIAACRPEVLAKGGDW